MMMSSPDLQLSLFQALQQQEQSPQSSPSHPPSINKAAPDTVLTALTPGSSTSLFGLSAPAAPPLPSTLADRTQTFATLPLIVLDLETTGLNPKKAEIMELTAIRFINGQEAGKLSTLVNPNAPIPPEVERLTGIDPSMVANAPQAEGVLRQFVEFATQDGFLPVCVGHNVMFDLEFLIEKLETKGILRDSRQLIRSEQALCTHRLAKRLMPGLPSYEGVIVGAQCGVINNNAHRAEADVYMAAGILYKLLEKVPGYQDGFHSLTLDQVLGFQGVLKR